MLIPVIVGLGILSVFKGKNKDSRAGKMTAERTHLFQSALRSNTLTPDAYEKLADGFEQQGLAAEAILLRKRAKLRGMTPEERKVRKDIFRKALACQDPDAVERVAAVYESQGATGSARRLRMQAIGLRTARTIKPAEPPVVENLVAQAAGVVGEILTGLNETPSDADSAADPSNDSDEEPEPVVSQAEKSELK
jgi:hypothetical protein